jgi:hypothetical protein
MVCIFVTIKSFALTRYLPSMNPEEKDAIICHFSMRNDNQNKTDI